MWGRALQLGFQRAISRHRSQEKLPRSPTMQMGWRVRLLLLLCYIPLHNSGLSSTPCLPAGTSSFGLSGVNAHLLLEASAQRDFGDPGALLMPWQHQRFHPLPPIHPLISRTETGGHDAPGSILLACNLSSQQAAYIRDHLVGGRVLVPATAFFELIFGGMSIANDDAAGVQMRPCLQGVSIQSPKLMSQETSLADLAGELVLVTIRETDNQVSISSPGGIVHVQGNAAPAPAIKPGTAELPKERQGPLLLLAHTPSLPGPGYNTAHLAGRDSVDGYIVHPTPADAAIHLSAVPGNVGGKQGMSRVPVAVEALFPLQTTTSGGRPGQFALAMHPTPSGDKSVDCSSRAEIGGGTVLSIDDLRAKLLPPSKAAPVVSKSRVTRPAAEAKAFEQENFIYCIDWQAASKKRMVGGPPHALGVRVACDSTTLTLAPASSSTTLASAGIQLLQNFLKNAPESIEVRGLRSHLFPGHSTAGHKR